ncbi:MAG: HU family DNA-binding protein [Planctomycetota bacterium]
MVTKKDIVIDLAKEFGLTQVATKKIVQGTFDKIIAVIADQGRIELRNFGVFEVKRRAPRKARNPKTGEEVQVPEKFVVAFKPGRKMEEDVEKAYENPAHRPAPTDDAADDDI